MFADYAIAGAFIIVASTCRLPDRSKHAFVALGIILVSVVSLPLITVGTAPFAHTYDSFLFIADSYLRLRDLILARFMFGNPLVWRFEVAIYASLPLAVSITYAVERNLQMVVCLVLAGLLAPFFYIFFPAAGPRVAFAGFPWSHPHPAWAVRAVSGRHPKNAFPSLHFAWVLILLLFARNKWLKCGLLAYAFFMAIATIGSGEHYGVDLIASVPYVMLVNWLSLYFVGRHAVEQK